MYNKRMPLSFSASLRVAVVLCGALIVATLVSFGSTLSASAATRTMNRPASGGELNFVQSATSSNVKGDSIFINNTLLNHHPQALLFVTANWDPGQNYTGFDGSHVGVRYDTAKGRWAIFNEDRSAMTVGAQFDVLAWTTSVPSDGFFTLKAGNARRTYLHFSNPLSNNNPDAHVFVTPSWNPAGSQHGVYDTHAVGVWYDSQAGEWEVYDEDGVAIPNKAAFNIYIDSSTTYPLTVTTNTNGMACIDSSSLNGNDSATPIITHNFTDDGISDVVGVWYDPGLSQWCIFDNTGTPLPSTAQFFVEP